MGFDDQLWNHLVREHGADRLTRPRGSQDASALRDRPRVRRGRHGWLLAPGIAAVAAVAIATGALQGARHSHGISSRTAIRRAAAFITPPAGAREIVHVQATITRTPLERSYEGLDRNVASITEDVWSVGGANPVERAILHPKGGDSYLELNGLRAQVPRRRPVALSRRTGSSNHPRADTRQTNDNRASVVSAAGCVG
jgi:hypothetical protein